VNNEKTVSFLLAPLVINPSLDSIAEDWGVGKGFWKIFQKSGDGKTGVTENLRNLASKLRNEGIKNG
jgi:hypothetical protein